MMALGCEVNGELIGRVEYEKAYSDSLPPSRTVQELLDDKLVEAFDLKNRALEGSLSRAIAQEAEKLGLTVTKAEIQKRYWRYGILD
jgi:hypothetical protein